MAPLNLDQPFDGEDEVEEVQSKKEDPKARRWTAKELLTRLEARYPRDRAWILFSEVPVRGGHRRIDGLALNLSGGHHELQGFEIKVSRQDVLKELNDMRKTEEGLMPYVNYWWLVCPRHLVKDRELPEGWGLLVPHGQGLKIAIQAPPRADVRPLDPYVCSVLIRRVWDDARRHVGHSPTTPASNQETLLLKKVKRLQTALAQVKHVLGLDYRDVDLDPETMVWDDKKIKWRGPLNEWELKDLVRWLQGQPLDDGRDVLQALTRARSRVGAQEEQLEGLKNNLQKLIEDLQVKEKKR